MLPLSSWAIQATRELPQSKPIAHLTITGLTLVVYLTSDSLWLVYNWPNHSATAFRAAFSPAGQLSLAKQQQRNRSYHLTLNSSSATYEVVVTFPDQQHAFFRYTTTLKPKSALLIPYWPKDILCFTSTGKIMQQGTIHTHQTGLRSGALYFSLPRSQSGSVFYFQNLTAINPYFQQTKTAASDLVGGTWPEIGFSLPPTTQEPLKKGQPYVVSDAFISLSATLPKTNVAIAQHYLECLSQVYIQLPKREPLYHDWLETVERGLADLEFHKGCWTFGGGHSYLNAYVSDYKTPPEIMVQLAVLLPMIEYIDWKGEKGHRLIDLLKAGIPAFYQEELKTIVRWLPALENQLNYAEEQKRPRVMDSWYLHHPLMNLARLAAKGDEKAKELLLNSVDYAINVAHTFKYKWPVFYQMDTLKIIKAETAAGAGGEKDVPSMYADVMLKTWKLTGEPRFLTEAKKV